MSNLAKIRSYLLAGASEEAWKGICYAVEDAETSEQELLLGYAAEYTKDWAFSLCRPLYRWWEQYRRGKAKEYKRLVKDWSGYLWEEGKTAGEVREIACLAGMHVVWIPAGSFLMGICESSERFPDEEKPEHEVTISRGFWMMKTPVTQWQYKKIMKKNPSRNKTAGSNAPVDCVSWHDAALFANRLSELEGLPKSFVNTSGHMHACGDRIEDYLAGHGWRLPTEAEWEYACHAEDPNITDYVLDYGELELDTVAWNHRNSHMISHTVGEKKANNWGLKDMLGNVWEWCFDRFAPDAYEILSSAKDNVDPVFIEPRTLRVIRGGGWNTNPRFIRTTARGGHEPTNYDTQLGFRLLRR